MATRLDAMLTRQQWMELGKQRREQAPRSEQAAFTPKPNRDPLRTIAQTNADRLEELVPMRYGRMAVSALAYLRGSASVMADDLSGATTTGILVQACGDCHLQNFGWFATPERRLIFDINDFDESFVAPWEWDVKRLASSVVVAAQVRGFRAADQESLAMAAVNSYRARMAEFALKSPLEIASFRLEDEFLLANSTDETERRMHKRAIDLAQKRSAERQTPRLAAMVGGKLRIVDSPPLVFHPPDKHEVHEELADLFGKYRESLQADRRLLFDHYEIADAAFKVVGVGSVGLRRRIALFLANDGSPLLLQMKQATESGLANYVQKHQGITGTPFFAPWSFANQGERIVTAQRIMQAASDQFLGWARSDDGRDYYIRQLRDMKASVDVLLMDEEEMSHYVTVCGFALARAHAKSGSAAGIASYMGMTVEGEKFAKAVTEFAFSYAKQAEDDHAQLVKAIQQGKINALQVDR